MNLLYLNLLYAVTTLYPKAAAYSYIRLDTNKLLSILDTNVLIY